MESTMMYFSKIYFGIARVFWIVIICRGLIGGFSSIRFNGDSYEITKQIGTLIGLVWGSVVSIYHAIKLLDLNNNNLFANKIMQLCSSLSLVLFLATFGLSLMKISVYSLIASAFVAPVIFVDFKTRKSKYSARK